MLTNPTLDQLKRLGLTGMAAAFEEIGQNHQAKELPHADWLALLLDREAAQRATKRLSNRLRAARLRAPDACIEDLDFKAPRGLGHRRRPQFVGITVRNHRNLPVDLAIAYP